MSTESREVHLVRRPHGTPVPEDFAVRTATVPTPGKDQVLVRTIAMSVDPYMRLRMDAGPSYAPRWELDGPMRGSTVGRVVASEVAGIPVGSIVGHHLGWREFAIVDAPRVAPVRRRPNVPLTHHLSVLGMPGLTAWVGLVDIAPVAGGDAVFVSGGAGAVGSVAIQLARLRGATQVVASAGSAATVRLLVEDLGADAAFDHHDAPVREQLRRAAPDGVDVYFDNIGGDHLEAALDVMRDHGRIALCGAISAYNATGPVRGPDNMINAVTKQLTLRGYNIRDHLHRFAEFEETVGEWLQSGKLTAHETVSEGLESAVPAFLGVLAGANVGKMIVRVAPDPA